MADNNFEAAPEGGVKLKDDQPKVQDVKAPEANSEETATEQSENGLAPAEEAKPGTPMDSAPADSNAEKGEDKPEGDEAPGVEDEKSEEEEV